MTYNILSTGSQGNALLINDNILIDCGVSFKLLDKYYKKLNFVFLTHEHCDHFNPKTIYNLSMRRPLIKFCCRSYLVDYLVKSGVKPTQIIVIDEASAMVFDDGHAESFTLFHNVQNCGWKINVNGKNLIYATDTRELDHIEAKGFDYYFIESNHYESEIKQIIYNKEKSGEYSHEKESFRNHLSAEKCDLWLEKNMKGNSLFVPMHESKMKGRVFNDNS